MPVFKHLAAAEIAARNQAADWPQWCLMVMGTHVSAKPGADAAADEVTALYQAEALGMVRLAYVMVGDLATAEDIVQDAFSGLYHRWEHLRDPARAVAYVRSAVLNSCRNSLRRARSLPLTLQAASADPALASAEAAVLDEEQRRAVVAALQSLPSRQREVIVLRFYLDMSESQVAGQMGIGPSTVRSAQHRALTTLGRKLKEFS